MLTQVRDRTHVLFQSDDGERGEQRTHDHAKPEEAAIALLHLRRDVIVAYWAISAAAKLRVGRTAAPDVQARRCVLSVPQSTAPGRTP